MVMSPIKKIDALVPTLESIGAVLIKSCVVIEGGDQIEQRFYSHKQRILFFTSGIRDSLSCLVSPKNVTEPYLTEKWESIFSFTEKNFKEMNVEQQMDWIISVPKGDDHVYFLTEKIKLFNSFDL